MISKEDLGWVAAIIDLKGRIDMPYNYGRRTQQTRIVVSSKKIEIIDRLSRMTETAAEERPADPLRPWMQRGCTEHCPVPHIQHQHESQMPMVKYWSVTGVSAAIVLYNILPYLTPVPSNDWKATLSALMRHAVLTGQGSGMTLKSVRRMAGLGWNIPPVFAKAVETQHEAKGNVTAKAASSTAR